MIITAYHSGFFIHLFFYRKLLNCGETKQQHDQQQNQKTNQPDSITNQKMGRNKLHITFILINNIPKRLTRMNYHNTFPISAISSHHNKDNSTLLQDTSSELRPTLLCYWGNFLSPRGCYNKANDDKYFGEYHIHHYSSDGCLNNNTAFFSKSDNKNLC